MLEIIEKMKETIGDIEEITKDLDSLLTSEEKLYHEMDSSYILSRFLSHATYYFRLIVPVFIAAEEYTKQQINSDTRLKMIPKNYKKYKNYIQRISTNSLYKSITKDIVEKVHKDD